MRSLQERYESKKREAELFERLYIKTRDALIDIRSLTFDSELPISFVVKVKNIVESALEVK